MTPGPVVAGDSGEDRRAGLRAGSEPVAVHQFTLEAGDTASAGLITRLNHLIDGATTRPTAM